ncbi:hypothetical protein [Comamonas testosteroni]|uniref:hypothetical protein n=1 Tax=Comamonas testosteroni TaxID=285 RepID=UPI000A9B31EB|nr:hypothetical protein [Comamonas testosteroni]
MHDQDIHEPDAAARQTLSIMKQKNAAIPLRLQKQSRRFGRGDLPKQRLLLW